ncbi:putative pumilio homolog 8, chloroplastic [Actinidia eriantha]|uniref:putative pumilio homolog 8, chloroplastic n=1 Tax=Actinidia eriantha TaxID=165200 RepID=UPI0025839584|nr:putative pumilio homolog 8, chloroplastic [Actinidia eriantha]
MENHEREGDDRRNETDRYWDALKYLPYSSSQNPPPENHQFVPSEYLTMPENHQFFAPSNLLPTENHQFFAPSNLLPTENHQFFAPSNLPPTENHQFFAPANLTLPENHQFFAPENLTLPENHQFFAPENLSPPENRQFFGQTNFLAPDNHLRRVPQNQPYINPSFPDTLYDDFSHLNLSSTPSLLDPSAGFGGSAHRNNDLLYELELANALHRMRVASAVRGQTGGSYLSPNNFQTADESGLDRFSLNYVTNNSYIPNGGGQGLFPGTGQNGFQSVYEAPTRSNGGFQSGNDMGDYGAQTQANGFQSGYHTSYGPPSRANGFLSGFGMGMCDGAPTRSNRGGFSQAENNHRRRGRFGSGSGSEGRNPGVGLNPSPSVVPDSLSSVSLEDLRGRLVLVAKDHHGYSYLTKKIKEGKREELDMIFLELKDHVRELMVDSYANYPIQELFTFCSEEQMAELLVLVIDDVCYFHSICVNIHGTRAVQAMLDHLTNPDHRTLAMTVLNRLALPLSKCMNGYHVIERCLSPTLPFTQDDLKDVIYIVTNNCVDIGTTQAGCCIVQKCVGRAEGEPRLRLISEIIANALVLSEDIFGNYIVQFIMGLGEKSLKERVLAQLRGHYVSLSLNKYGSNVVEKCMKETEGDQYAQIFKEIINSPNFLMLLQDPFGNYVAQTAFETSKGALHHALVSLVQFHYPYLHSHPHGKRVLSKTRGFKHYRSYDYRRYDYRRFDYRR